MGISNYTYRLKAQAGQSAPVDELGGSTLTGSTQTLVDRGSGDYAWQFAVGQAIATIPNKVFNSTAGNGATFLLSGRITNYGTLDFNLQLGFGPSTFGANTGQGSAPGIAISRVAANQLAVSHKNNMYTSAHALAANTEFTVVVRMSKAPSGASGFDRIDVWFKTTGRSGTAPDQQSQLDLFANVTYNNLTINASNGTVLQYKDIVWWGEELTDANCAALADDARGTLDGAPPDTTAPTFTGSMTTNSITSTSAVVDWSATTHTDNVGITDYEYSFNGSSYTAIGSTATNRSFTGLTASTPYTVYIRAKDAAGNTSSSLSVNFTTSAAGDTTAPTMNGSLTLSAITKNGATATWSAASDNVAVTGYEISCDTGTPSWTDVGNVLTYGITGKTELSTYTVRVRAYDAAGNKATALTATLNTIGATFTFDTMENNTHTAWVSQAVVWNWWPGGRVGALVGITPKQGTGTIDASGVLVTSATLPSGAGLGLVAKQNTSALDDAVFLQAGTAA